MAPGYIRSAQRFNLRAFLEHWSGFNTLKVDDFKFIEARFIDLVKIALCHGTIHPEFSSNIMGNFIYEKHMEDLSEVALKLLVAEEARKPVSERPVSSFGATILTNPGHRDFMRQRMLNRIEEERNRLDAAEVANAQGAIARINVATKKAAAALKRVAAEIQLRTSAFEVFDIYKTDVAAVVEDGNPRRAIMLAQARNTNALSAGFIDAAYRFFVKRNIPAGEAVFTKKADKLNAVLHWFGDNYEDTLREQTTLMQGLADDAALNLGNGEEEPHDEEFL
jgi:hypothetical protein